MALLEEPVLLSAEGGEVEGEGSTLQMFLRTFVENKLAVAGVVMIAALIVFCWLVPIFYHSVQDGSRLSFPNGLKATNAGPLSGAPLGTDGSGNDILGRLMRGGQISLEIGFLVGVFSTVLGLVVGAISGFFGKWLDAVLMRIVDIGFAVPIVFLVIYIASVERKTTFWTLVLVLTIVTWLVPARLVRGETLSLRGRDYVQAMRTMGGGSTRAILTHIIPNAIGTIVVTITFQIADAVILLSTLQYFGFGLPPSLPTWGTMLSDAIQQQNATSNNYWWEVYPAGIMIILTVLAVNFLGDAMRDAFEVRLQKR